MTGGIWLTPLRAGDPQKYSIYVIFQTFFALVAKRSVLPVCFPNTVTSFAATEVSFIFATQRQTRNDLHQAFL